MRAERTRALQALSWVSGGLITRDLPKDTTIKKIVCRISGTVVTGFSTTPVAYETSTFQNLVNNIQVTVNGNNTVKSVMPHFLSLEQLLYSGVTAERKASAAAAAAHDNNPTADAGFVYGSTTNTTTVAESITISFEHPFGDLTTKKTTYLNLKGVSSAEIKFQCGTTADLDKTVNCTFTSASFTIDITIFEADYPSDQPFAVYKQSWKETVISSAGETAIDLPMGNWITGIKLFCIQDHANTLAAAGGRRPNDNGISTMKIVINGMQTYKQFDWRTSQYENRSRFGIVAAYASNVTRLAGFTRLELCENQDLQSALYAKRPQVDSLQLLLTTKANDATNNLYPLKVYTETEEIVR